jgi:pyridoxal phosphate-dependent aminotransferase EpsN
VFFDVDPHTWTLDPGCVTDELARRRRRGERLPAAVIPVDLYGRCADLRGAAVELERQGIPLLTDAAESLGALTHGRPAGSVGAAAALSFNGNKIITTSGGGALVTDEEAIARRVRHLATQAREPVRYYEHIDVGFNHRLSNVLAALGSSQLKTLAQRVDRRRAINDRYREGLSDVPWVHIADPLRDEDVAGGCAPTRWLTCLTISDGAPVDRDGLIDALEKEGIEARPVWKPMHLQPVYADAPHVGGQVAESAFARGVALPSGSGLDDGDIDRVVDAILSVG